MHTRILTAVFLLTSAVVPVLAQAPQPPPASPQTWNWRAADLAFPEGKTSAWVPADLVRLYKVVEDKDAGQEKALRVYADQRVLQDKNLPDTDPKSRLPKGIPIVRTAPLTVPVGVYRVTVRMKMTGMLNVIGNGIRFSSSPWPAPLQPDTNSNHRSALRFWESTIHGYHFREEDVYQEFSYLTEVIEPDIVTGRPARPGPRNPFGELPPKKDVEAYVRGEGAPWERAAKETKPLPTAPADLAKYREGRLAVEMDFLETMKLGFGRVQPTIRHVTVDWLKVERVPEPERIEVRSVVPMKLLVPPGGDTEFRVWLHNRSGAPRSGVLRMKVQHGLTDEIVVAERPVQMADRTYAVEKFQWKAPDRDLWGCAAVAELLVDGKPVGSAEDVFSVHRNPWAVKNHGGANRWASPYSKLPSYLNYMEFFGGTPGDALKVWPDDPKEPYISGMSDFYTHMDVQKMFVAYNRSIGVTSFLYIQPACGTGTFPELLYQEHPEWFSAPLGWNDQIHDRWEGLEKLMREKWHAGADLPDRKAGLLHIEAPINYAIPYMFETLLDGSLKNLAHVGWDGIRWDGDFPVKTVSNKHVAFGPGSPEKDRQLSADYCRRFKKTVRDRFPAYTEGANIGTPEAVWNRKFAENPPKTPTEFHDALLSDGSSVMSEDWMSAWIYTDSRNVIRDYYWGARRCVEWCRERGGFWHSFPPDRDANPYFTQSMIYYNLLIPLAGGSYPGMYSCTPGSETGVAHFVTRCSEFLYDLKLQPLANAADEIKVDTDQELWFADGTRWRDLPNGGRRYVIPLINPPTIERFLQRDRFSELPEPVRQPFPVDVELPDGFGGARVFMLTAEPRTAVAELKAKVAKGRVTVEVPGLTIYRVLVVEFAKG